MLLLHDAFMHGAFLADLVMLNVVSYVVPIHVGFSVFALVVCSAVICDVSRCSRFDSSN